MPPLLRRVAVPLLAVAFCVGCREIEVNDESNSPLAPAKMSPDSVGLEIFYLRAPLGDPEVNGPLWNHIDEQQLDIKLRHELAENGVRVGVVGGRLPPALERLMRLDGKPRQPSASQVIDLEADSAVTGRRLQTRKGKRNELLVSGVYDEMSLLLPEDGGLVGRNYDKGQGVFELRVLPLGDGRLRLRLVPEVHYGDQVQRFRYGQGRVRIDPGRRRDVFDRFAMETVLSPGQMLVATCCPDREGSLGHRFFYEDSGGTPEQKLLVIRLAQTQYDDKYAGDELLPLADDFE